MPSSLHCTRPYAVLSGCPWTKAACSFIRSHCHIPSVMAFAAPGGVCSPEPPLTACHSSPLIPLDSLRESACSRRPALPWDSGSPKRAKDAHRSQPPPWRSTGPAAGVPFSVAWRCARLQIDQYGFACLRAPTIAVRSLPHSPAGPSPVPRHWVRVPRPQLAVPSRESFNDTRSYWFRTELLSATESRTK